MHVFQKGELAKVERYRMHFDECLRGSGLWFGDVAEAHATSRVRVKDQRLHRHW